jgi:ATP-dependent helicase/nuclease subunit A
MISTPTMLPTSMSTAAAFEHHGRPVARQRFYQIACDPQRSVAVEACAGAGKTWMLVSRMLRALLEGCAPQNILAITFTKKAAGEMRQRLHDWLAQFAQMTDAQLRSELLARGFAQEPTPQQLRDVRQLHTKLLQAGRPVQIRTFHSWFAALLRSAPLAVLQDLGLPSAYELLENDAQAVAQVWRRFQARVAQDPGQRTDYFAAVGQYGRHQTHKALEAALRKRVEFVLADAHGVVDTSVQTFAQQYPEFAHLDAPLDCMTQPPIRTLLLDAARMLGASSLVISTKAATALEIALTQASSASVFDALLTKAGTPRKFSDKLLGLDTVMQAQGTLLRIREAQAQHEAWLHQQRMARLTRGLVADYGALKRERGWIDMGDLERAALVLMSDPVLSGWVQERLDARVQHLLIDEFQDTNPLQWQALRAWLEGYAGAGHAPSVFIVGDPKQSIYRFRRAEPQVFRAAQAFVVEGLGGELLSCDHTRRNASAVIGLVNQVMLQAQLESEFESYRAHTTESTAAGHIYKLPRIMRGGASTSAVDKDEEGLTEWRDSLTAPRHVLEETNKTLECRQAAQWLAQYLGARHTRLQWRDVMVLARKRERLGRMQAELAALGIPAQQPEKTELADMPEVQDVVALLDVLVSPRHDLSLARALKSPLFGVSDADLVQLVLRQRQMQARVEDAGAAQEGESPTVALLSARSSVSWMQVLQQGMALPSALAGLGEVMTRWMQWVGSLPPHDALSAIYQDGDVLARYAAATPAHQREAVLANLRAIPMAALQLDGGRYTSAYALVRALRTPGTPAPVRSDADAVRLLTIHGAKGLEAPLVLLLDTDGESVKAETMGVLVVWPGEHAYPQRFVFLANESKPSACVANALTLEQAARRREELNALYVALTRAQQTLVVSSLEPHAGKAGSWWQRLEAHALDAPWIDIPNSGATGSAVLARTTEPLGAGVSEPVYNLKVMPNLPANFVEFAQSAIKYIAIPSVVRAPLGTENDHPDSVESRIGQAMHRLLEWVAPRPAESPAFAWSADQMESVARDFVLEPEQVLTAQHMAQRILAGEGGWAWHTEHIGWHANEVTLVHRGRTLRLDRLVQHRTTGEWWVLDYKSNTAPQHQAELCAQLSAYRIAVAQAYPGQAVRAVFLTAQGALIEID